ncbi:MAG: IclR family transcriptional regulator [Deferrisomatales bacterium]
MGRKKTGEGARERGDKYNVRAIERALATLNAFTHERRQLSLTEVAERTGLSKPTAFRILATLEYHHFVACDGADGLYRLGPKLLGLGGIVLSSLSLRGAARPHLDRLQRETGVTVLYGALVDGQLLYVDKRESEGPIRIVSDVGLARPPHYGMLGTVLMAFLEEGETRRLLERYPLAPYTRHSITDPDLFLERLRQTRRLGYVVEVGEAIEGVWGVAAPVRDAGGRVAAGVGAATPLTQRPDDRMAETVASVLACARGISQALGAPEA